MKKDLKRINDIVSRFINDFLLDDSNMIHIERLNHFRSFTRILLDNIPNIEKVHYKNKVSKDECINYAYYFLESLSPEYGLYLFNRLDDKTIKFIKHKDALANGENLYCNITINDKCNHINIIDTNDISVTYSIIHEILHETNYIYENDNPNFHDDTRDYFTETVSLLGTTLAHEFYELRYPNNKEFRNDSQDDFYGLYKKAAGMDYVLRLIDAYIFNDHISNQEINMIEKDKSDFYLSAANEYIEDVLEYDYDEYGVDCLDILYNESYLVAGLLVTYILANYPNYEQRVNVLKDLNELIMVRDYKDIFTYLNLDVYELNGWFIDLTDESLQQLEKCFKEESKKM